MTRALSLTQPWASLCVWLQTGADGPAEKQYETRSRGCSWARNMKPETIYIHASKSFPRWAKDACDSTIFQRVLARHGWDDSYEDLPVGGIIGSVHVVRSLATESVRDVISTQERAFGNYDDGRIAIELAHARPFDGNFLCAGALGLWTVPGGVERNIISSYANIPIPATAVEPFRLR